MNPKNIEVRFCTKCVVSNLRPSSTVEFLKKSSSDHNSINLGNEGICDACLYHTIKEEKIDWDSREDNLLKLCDKYRKSKGYDVIVPGSGGKDSAFTSHILKYKIF